LAIGTIFEPRLGHGRREPRPERGRVPLEGLQAIKRGIVARKVQEIRLQRVQNVNYTQSVYERVMQIGDATHIVTGLAGETEARS
jgi:Bacterial PH domain